MITINIKIAVANGYMLEDRLLSLGVLKYNRLNSDATTPLTHAFNIRWVKNHLFVAIPSKAIKISTWNSSVSEALESPYTNLYVVTFNKEKTKELLRELAREPEHKKIIGVTTYGDRGEKIYSRQFEAKPKGNGIVLCPNLQRDLEEDIQKFLNNKELYESRGIEYRRGYLLYGPPGNGKSSIVKHIAIKYGLSVAIFSSKCLRDNSMWNAIGHMLYTNVWLFEDIDAFFDGREVKKNGLMDFSEFINLIDGVNSPTNRIIFMTTNHLENLDEALFRPGRIDRIFEIKKATKYQAEKLFCKIFPGNEEYAPLFAEKINDYQFSMAELECKLLAAGSAVEALKIPNG